MTINTKEPVRFVSRDGQTYPARIICDDAKGGFPIRALADYGDREEQWAFRSDGSGHGGRLENIPEERTVTLHINIFERDDKTLAYAYLSRHAADIFAGTGRTACRTVTLTYTKGEGL